MIFFFFFFFFFLEKRTPSVETCLNIDTSHQDSGSIWDHSRTVAASGITPEQWQHLGSLQDSGSIWDHSRTAATSYAWDHSRTVAASGITPGQWQHLGSLQDSGSSGITPGQWPAYGIIQDSGSIWDHSSTAATSYAWDHCRMCVLMSGNSGYLIWGSS